MGLSGCLLGTPSFVNGRRCVRSRGNGAFDCPVRIRVVTAQATARGVQHGEQDIPIQQKVLSGFLSLSSTPYSSYVPSPVSVLHKVDARIKQAGIVIVLFLLTGGSSTKQAFLAAFVLGTTLVNIPWRTSRQQLTPLLIMCTLYFVLTCLFSDGPPPVTQSHVPPNSIQNLPPLNSDPNSYSYVIFKLPFITVTRKSVKFAVSASSLLFVALQSASLCLVTTPPEELALSVGWYLRPFKLIGIPVQEIQFTLLMSLRFLSVVFDEVRNLALGVAVRGINWRSVGRLGSIRVLGGVVSQLFRKLFWTSENVAQAMRMRGFIGPENHRLYLMHTAQASWLASCLAVGVLTGVVGICRVL